MIGYCFGGLCALDVARMNVEGVKAVVSYHGTLSLLPDDGTIVKPDIKASVLVAHGGADLYVSLEEVQCGRLSTPRVLPTESASDPQICFSTSSSSKRCESEMPTGSSSTMETLSTDSLSQVTQPCETFDAMTP